MSPEQPRRTPLGRELLTAFAVLFLAAVLLAALGLSVLLPVLDRPGETLAFITVLMVADLAVIFLFGSWILRRRLVEPTERMAADVERIAGGDYRHRVAAADSPELQVVQESVNAMADRLTRDQALLAENVESLEATNQELVGARNQVIQAARLASVGTLAAGIAHEVGNPLGAVFAYLDVARRRAERGDADPEILDSIRDEARRIDRIVRSLLDYARPREDEASPVAPSAVLERVRELLTAQGRLDGVDDRWDLEADAPPVVMVAHRLEQVMVNLLLNAVDALDGRPDGRVEVGLTTRPGEVQSLPRRREDDPPGVDYMHRRRVSRDQGGAGVDPVFTAPRVVVITVRDNGPGIDEEDMKRVFDPFFTTKDPGRGTGLGLSICARLVEGMGGRIEVARGALGGAEFTIRLPGAVGVEEGGAGRSGEEASGEVGQGAGATVAGGGADEEGGA